MKYGFLIGLGFASAEHVIKAIAENISKFSAAKLTTSIVFESPSFVAFAFLAGVAADWLTDTKVNHSAAILAAFIIWLASLLLRHVLIHNGFHLESIFLNSSYGCWGGNVFVVCLVAWLLAISPYFYWNELIGVAFPTFLIYLCIITLMYFICVGTYLKCIFVWESNKCYAYIRERILMYCKRLPEHHIRLASNPGLLAKQDFWFIDAKRNSAQVMYDAWVECWCLEDNLVNAVQIEIRLRDKEIRSTLRNIIREIGVDIELDLQAFNLIVGDDNQYRKAKDILLKSRYSANVPALEETRFRILQQKR